MNGQERQSDLKRWLVDGYGYRLETSKIPGAAMEAKTPGEDTSQSSVRVEVLAPEVRDFNGANKLTFLLQKLYKNWIIKNVSCR